MDELKQQTIEFYSKLLKLPTFKHCNDIIQHLDDGAGYADFLIELMKMSMIPDRLRQDKDT